MLKNILTTLMQKTQMQKIPHHPNAKKVSPPKCKKAVALAGCCAGHHVVPEMVPDLGEVRQGE
jgi:hypothetical protein